MAGRYNEGKAIDAVLRCIEARDQVVRRSDGRSPDDLNDPDPLRRVDYVCTVGDVLYAFEHTGIEPFRDQIELEVQNRKLFEPIRERFDNRADEEFWELHFTVVASAGLRGAARVRQVQDVLINWIEMNFERCPVTRYGDRYTLSDERVIGLPFSVSLRRSSFSSRDFPHGSPLAGRFDLRPHVSADLEPARILRLQKACGDKFPKLAIWKRDGAKAVLVLEENDRSLTNHQSVADALAPAEETMPDTADEVFLVSTPFAHKWWVTCLRRAGKTYYDEGERFHEVDPAMLSQLTSR